MKVRHRAATYAALLTLATGTLTGAEPDRVLPDVVVTAKRPLKDIGLTRTVLDSITLKENAALSVADVLAYNSTVFVKNYGRATQATVSFRGAAPSHTRVTWNGMEIDDPMLGMTDFSQIPSFFVDEASLLHGSSSVTETGGALGGVVKLATAPQTFADTSAWRLQYVQGAGSFRTFDEFLRAAWVSKKWSASTRVAYSSSANDFKYTNHDKKENIYDDNHNIIGQYHPTERNRNGDYKDLNVLQQIYYDTRKGDRAGLNLWYADSDRGLPLLTTDYGDDRQFENRNRHRSLRGVLTWNRFRTKWTLAAWAGYAYSCFRYKYEREITAGNWAVMSRSHSTVNTAFAKGEFTWHGTAGWLFGATLSARQHRVESRDKDVVAVDGQNAVVGYSQARFELSAALSARWQPTDRVGAGLTLRPEMYGDRRALVPAVFADALLWRPFNLQVRASASRGNKFPSLNDLYFLPGGNPDLKNETSVSYDLAVSVERSFLRPFAATAGLSLTWFENRVDNWILWLPTTKGYYSPRNVRKVHAYGIEGGAHLTFEPGRSLNVRVDATYAWTPAVNRAQPMSEADNSVGRQLPYTPRSSANASVRIGWRQFALHYMWAYHSERNTMTAADHSLSGVLPPYYMSNVVISYDFRIGRPAFQLKLAVNNIFNEEYQTVLSHPMPGINFEAFLGITL